MDHQQCNNLRNSLSDFVDGMLGEELCAEIERHMAGCENCRIVIDSLRKTVYLYHATSSEPALPDDVRLRLFHSLDLDDFIKK